MGVKVISGRRSPSRTRAAPTPPAPAPRISPPGPSGPILLSILIPTIPTRAVKLQRLLDILDPQVRDRRDVEILCLRDNRSMSIGEKRNRMRSIARGDYVAFVDDDDVVSHDYVARIVAALGSRPDVVTFRVRVEGYGPAKPCRYGLGLSHADLPSEYHRKPNHLMAWRRDLANQIPFPLISHGEDTQWAEQIAKLATAEIALDAILYQYLYDSSDR